MRLYAALLAVLFALPARAGGTIAEAALPGAPAILAANGQWTSPCQAVVPPFDVAVALEAGGTLTVQRFADKSCQFPVRAPIAAALTDAGNCYAEPAFCGDAASPDAVPHLGLRVTLKDTSGRSNHIYGVRLVQDPPAPTAAAPAEPEAR